MQGSFKSKTEEESKKWRSVQMTQLPTYIELCKWENQELLSIHKGKMPSIIRWFFICFGFGHVITNIGRKCCSIALYSYYIWLSVSFGIWTEDAAYCYDIKMLVENTQLEVGASTSEGGSGNDNESGEIVDADYEVYGKVVMALLGVRSMIFQLVPELAVLRGKIVCYFFSQFLYV